MSGDQGSPRDPWSPSPEIPLGREPSPLETYIATSRFPHSDRRFKMGQGLVAAVRETYVEENLDTHTADIRLVEALCMTAQDAYLMNAGELGQKEEQEYVDALWGQALWVNRKMVLRGFRKMRGALQSPDDVRQFRDWLIYLFQTRHLFGYHFPENTYENLPAGSSVE